MPKSTPSAPTDKQLKHINGALASAKTHAALNGGLLNVREAARLLGMTEKSIRHHVSRRTIPFRKWGVRIMFLRIELMSFIEALDGASFDEARANVESRR